MAKKQCISCKEHLELDKFRVRKTPLVEKYIVAKCRKCETAYNKVHCDKEKRRKRERERLSEPLERKKRNKKLREHRANNPDKHLGYWNKYSVNNKTKLNKWNLEQKRKQRENITDWYVARLIIGKQKSTLTVKQIIKQYPELIEAYRGYVKSKRLITTKMKTK